MLSKPESSRFSRGSITNALPRWVTACPHVTEAPGSMPGTPARQQHSWKRGSASWALGCPALQGKRDTLKPFIRTSLVPRFCTRSRGGIKLPHKTEAAQLTLSQGEGGAHLLLPLPTISERIWPHRLTSGLDFIGALGLKRRQRLKIFSHWQGERPVLCEPESARWALVLGSDRGLGKPPIPNVLTLFV